MDIEDQVTLEGYEPGTEAYERVFLERRVKKCQELQNVTECQNCPAFDRCDMAHQYLIQLRYRGR